MVKRKQLSKKVRFEVFKRDSFTCQYCGAVPPSVILEVDHVIPVASDGDNEIDNLVTSCFDCNRGKGARSLNSIPQSLVIKTEVMIEKEDQLKEFKKLKSRVKARQTRQVNKVANVFSDFFEERELTDKSKRSIRAQFLPNLDIETLVENMEMACDRKSNSPQGAFKYFCGICWNMIKANDNG